MHRRRKRPQPPRTLLESLRHFLTPAVWKQGHQGGRRRRQRWSLQPLVLVLLGLPWCCGDSETERFATARVPLRAFRNLAAGIRARWPQLLGERWLTAGWLVFGCDGSRLECPRPAELEQRLGQCSKDGSAPMIWVTALVHLATGTLWSWQLGRGTASELWHLSVPLLRTLPAGPVLLVADAAYISYALLMALLDQQTSFPIRLSSRAWLYTDE